MKRRTLLRSLGSAALALPCLSLGRSSRAQPTAPPKRFLVWFTGNGVYKPEWFPTGTEHDWVLSPSLEPLARHKDRLLVFGARDWEDQGFRDHLGLSIKCVDDLPSGGHGLAMTLTGRPSAEYDGVSWASAPSIDQLIADQVGRDTRFPSLEVGVRVQGNEGSGKRLVYRGAGAPVPAESDPVALFDRVFGTLTLDPAARERELAGRQRVVDFLHGRFSTLRSRLDTTDRRTLDAHSEALFEVESRLLDVGEQSCTLPDRPTIPDAVWNDYSNMPIIMRAQMDNIAMAFACDLTRVATLQITEAASNARYPFLMGPTGLPIDDTHHGLSHEPWANAEAMQKLVTINRWHSEQLAYLMDRLSETPDVDGSSVLDNTIILWVNELSDGRFHTHQNMPWLLAGGGGLRTGRYLQVADVAHNDLLLACMNLMGVEADYVGSPEWTTGPMTGLT
ncbi:MAG: DUF1552 domain-containing protein [Myxococcota bacterium]